MSKNGNPAFFPVLINLEKFPCLVVGGGNVALRKVLSLLEFDAVITVISPRLCKPLIELSKKEKIKIIRKVYSKEYLADFKIVFCATDNGQVNKTVNQHCREKGILINVADDPSLCDFILPANIKRGNLTISVASQGMAPFFTREIKEKIDELISPVYSDIADLAKEFRKKLLVNAKTKTSSYKSKMFKKFTATDWEKFIKENGKIKSIYRVRNILKEVN